VNMKLTILFLAVTVGVCVYGELLNEDELRDISNYANNRRSKRALCGAVRTTQPPPTRATYRPWTIPRIDCRYCNCYPIMTSKRDVVSNSKAMIYPYRRCSDYSYCCRNRYPFSVAKGAMSASLSTGVADSMASSLINKFGKRASDNKFKKASVDLIFVIDDSGSINPAQFKVAKEGAATLSQALCPHQFGSGEGEKQVSVVQFSTMAKTILTYRDSQKGAGYVENAILNMEQSAGATSTTDAIMHVRENVLTQPGSRLNDPDTATIVFVITDGKCNNGCYELKEESR